MDISRGTWADAGMTTSLYYDVPRLVYNKEYLFRVKAINTIGDSDYLETAKTTIARNEFGMFPNCNLNFRSSVYQKQFFMCR